MYKCSRFRQSSKRSEKVFCCFFVPPSLPTYLLTCFSLPPIPFSTIQFNSTFNNELDQSRLYFALNHKEVGENYDVKHEEETDGETLLCKDIAGFVAMNSGMKAPWRSPVVEVDDWKSVVEQNLERNSKLLLEKRLLLFQHVLVCCSFVVALLWLCRRGFLFRGKPTAYPRMDLPTQTRRYPD